MIRFLPTTDERMLWAFVAEVAAAVAELAALVALVAAWDAEVAEAEALFELLVA
jgi:hypothetical protein